MKNDFPRLDNKPKLRHKMTERAREFRKEPTKSEKILWQALRGRKLDGVKFRRQQPVGQFIVDFYNSTYRLVVEIDGDVHDLQKDADRAREELLEAVGMRVLRLKSDAVERDLSKALNMIHAKIEEIKLMATQYPSPVSGEGKGERV